MNSATVGPSEFKHVVEVVGDAQQFLVAVVCGGDGMHQQVGFRCSADDVAVAVGAVAEHGTGDVRPVAVQVLSVVAAGIQAEGGADRSGGRERQNARDVVPKIRMHVGVVDAVVKPRIGHGDDDTGAVQTGPGCIDVGHVGAVPHVIDMHDLNAHGVHDFEERARFDPLDFVLLDQPSEVVGRQCHGGESSAVRIQGQAGLLGESFRECFA